MDKPSLDKGFRRMKRREEARGVKKSLFRNNKRCADRSGQLRLKLIAPWHQSALDSPHGVVSSRRIEKAFHLIGSFVSEWTRIVRCTREDHRDVFFSCACTFHRRRRRRRRRIDGDVAGLTDSQSDYVPLAAPRERKREREIISRFSLRFQSPDLMPIITVLGQIVRRPPPAVFYGINYVYSSLTRSSRVQRNFTRAILASRGRSRDSLPSFFGFRLMTLRRRIVRRIHRRSSTFIVRVTPRVMLSRIPLENSATVHEPSSKYPLPREHT